MSARDYYDGGQQGQDGGYEARSNEVGYGGRDNGGVYEADNQEGQGRRLQDGRYGGGRENDYSTQPVNDGVERRHNNYGGGGCYARPDDDDLSGAAQHAERHAGSSGDFSIFSSVLSSLGQNKQSIGNSNLNEQDAVQSHQQYFGSGLSEAQATSSSMGSAAAMQALKYFSGGSSGTSQQGNSQNLFIGMAMAEASKLFDNQSSQGNTSNASKEYTIQKAGEMALKMYIKSNSGGSGGGASGLLGLASKFV
ncbi:beta-flanking protein [Diplocarpon rosae]|nr:beta-flanking protein [Diplocarpon rosae]